MDNFIFHSPTEFIFGRGTQKEVGKTLKRYGAGKVMLVYGGGSAERSGLIKEVTDSLKAEGLDYVTLKGVKPNPEADLVYEGIAMAVKEGVTFMLAVGGDQ